MSSVTINREVAVHFWPVDRNAPSITCSSGQVEVGVVEDDGGVLAAHLGLRRHAARGRGRGDPRARFRWSR